MIKNAQAWWEDYYGRAENFAKLFADHLKLKSKSDLSQEERVQLRAVTNAINGKFPA